MGKLYGLEKTVRQDRAEDLLKRFDLYEKREVAVNGFFKGMKQRLQICMALISEPQVLLWLCRERFSINFGLGSRC